MCAYHTRICFRGAHVLSAPQLMALAFLRGVEFVDLIADHLVVPSSLPKRAWEVCICKILRIPFWGLSLADWWGSEPHREVEDRPGIAFGTVAPWDSSDTSGVLQGSARESKPCSRKRGGSDPRAGAILPLQQGVLIYSVGGLIPAKSGGQSCLCLFWSIESCVCILQIVYYRLSAETQFCEELGLISHVRRREVSAHVRPGCELSSLPRSVAHGTVECKHDVRIRC